MITQSLKRFSMLAAFLVAATTIQAAAADVSQITNLPGGVACVPDCGTGDVALDLAKDGKFLVLAMDPDAGKVATLQKMADVAGLFGRSLYVEQGTTDRIPFADNYVDLLVLTGTEEKDLSAAASQEIMRVLTPIHGRLVLKDRTIVKPELPGSDWWPHKLRGPDNNFASHDTAFQWPPILQFRAMPVHNSYQGAALSVAGKIIVINDWVYKTFWRSELTGSLIVRSIYNGRILWHDFAPEGIDASMPVFAATETELFLAAGDRAAVVRRSLENGKMLSPILLGGEDQRVRWLALANNTLFTLAGAKAELRTPFGYMIQPISQVQHSNQTLFGTTLTATDLKTGQALWTHTETNPIDFRMVAVRDGKLFFYSENKRLAALDAGTGKPVWENTDRSWIDKIKRPVIQINGNVEKMSTLVAGSGLIRVTPYESGTSMLFRESDGGFISSQTGRFIGGGQKMPIVEKDGKVFLGSNEIDPRTGTPGKATLPAPVGQAWCGIATYAPGIGMVGHGTLEFWSPCGVGVWVAGGVLNYVPTHCGCGAVPGAAGFVSGDEIFKRAKEAPQHPWVKGPAFGATDNRQSAPANPNDWTAYRGNYKHTGASPVAVPTQARLGWTWKPATPFPFNTNYIQYGLEFDERPVPPLAANGMVFTAGSDGIVCGLNQTDGKLAWSFYADGPIFTPPAYENGRLFVPCGDGSVYALDAKTGQLAWKRRLAPVERRILMFDQIVSTWPVFSVVVRDGCVYAVAGHIKQDGSKAFALNATSGEIVWSRYFEPYCAPSYITYVFDRYAFGGHLTLVKDKLWAAGFNSIPMVLDAKTGEPQVPTLDANMEKHRKVGYGDFGSKFQGKGQDIINLDDRAILHGGNYLLDEHQTRDAARGRMNYKIALLEDSGLPVLDVARLPAACLYLARLAPAYDAENLAFVAKAEGKTNKGRFVPQSVVSVATVGINFWDKAAFIADGSSLEDVPEKIADPAKAAERNAKRAARAAAAVSGKPLPPDDSAPVEGAKDLDYSKALWQYPDVLANGIVLAKNAVIVAQAGSWKDMSNGFLGGKNKERIINREPLMDVEGWKIVAYDRTNGRELWSVPLPAEPLFNGLAIAADGTVVVTLRDGSVVGVK